MFLVDDLLLNDIVIDNLVKISQFNIKNVSFMAI
jgi:hypothetical protein